jgi:ParG
MTKKQLTVPKSGTQPASTTTPIDNMISGVKPEELPNSFRSTKRSTSFNLNRDIFTKFKIECSQRGTSMSTVIEEFMTKYING